MADPEQDQDINDSGSYHPHADESNDQSGVAVTADAARDRFIRTWTAEELAGAAASTLVDDPLAECEATMCRLMLAAAERPQGALDFLLVMGEDEDLSAEEPELSDDDPADHRYELNDTVSIGDRSLELAGYDRQLERPVIVHFLYPSLADKPEQRERFLRGARCCALLSHPNIRPVFDAGICQAGLPYMCQRVMDAERLGDLLDMARGGAVPDYIAGWRKRVGIMLRIADGVTAAHADGIVHQNLKPGLIWIGDRGEVTVDGWFSAVMPGDRGAGTVHIEGTPAYMSPEQVSGDGVDARSDVYALGAIWYELLTLRLPCWNSDPESMLELKTSGAWKPLDAAADDQVPAALLAISQRAMERDPQRRFPHAGAFADALRDAWEDRRSQVVGHAGGGANRPSIGLIALGVLLGFAVGVLLTVFLLR